MKFCWKGWSSHGRRQKFFQGGNFHTLLIILRLLTLQCKWTFTKRFPVSTLQRKFPMKVRAPFASILRSFSCGTVGYTSLSQTWTFSHLLQRLLNWHINVVIIVNSTQITLKWTWTISNYLCSPLIFLCLLNRTHFWNLLSELFSTLRLSEMLFLSINCLITILRALSTNKS